MNNKKACLTQLAEYRFCKPKVAGSSPAAGLKIKKAIIEAYSSIVRGIRSE